MHQFAYTRVESNRGNLYAIQIAKVSDYGRSQIENYGACSDCLPSKKCMDSYWAQAKHLGFSHSCIRNCTGARQNTVLQLYS